MSATTSPLGRLRAWLAQDTRPTAVVGGDKVASARRRHGPIVGALVALKVWVWDTWVSLDPVGPHKESPSYVPMPDKGTADMYNRQPWQRSAKR